MARMLTDKGMIRRDFLGWLCKIGGGCTAVTLGGGLAPLRKINTVLLSEASAATCLEDKCATLDSGGVCTTRDVCDEDSSDVCTNDECTADSSGACSNDSCVSDQSGKCSGDSCTSDSSEGCETDQCVSDISSACTGDSCGDDASGGCTGDSCGNDASGGCTGDNCTDDNSGELLGRQLHERQLQKLREGLLSV